MTSPGLLILALVVAIAVILFCIIVLKLNAAIGMVIACLVMGGYGWTRFAHYNIDDCVWIWKYDDKYRFTGWFWYDSWTAYE